MRERDHPLYPNGGDPKGGVAIVGDWHGNTFWAMRMLERIAETGARVILHAGDWGLWKQSPSMIKYVSRQNRLLVAADAYLVVTLGNHEDYDLTALMPADPGTGLLKLTNRIWVFPRGYRWRWGGTEWLSLGGAVSVDRDGRKAGRDWWPQEVLSQADIEHAIGGGPADVMITHDAPHGVYIPCLRPGDWPADAIADSNAHRVALRQVVDAVRPRHLFHGHYHVAYTDNIDLGWRANSPEWDGLLRVRGLDCDQGRWSDNLAVVGIDGARPPWPRTEQ